MAITFSMEESIAEEWPLESLKYTICGSETFAQTAVLQRELPHVGCAIDAKQPTTR